MGYGGNYNSTTRFRRYDGNEAGITDPKVRPAILKEYTDTEHLLKANHWYHIKITNENNRVSYYIDGKETGGLPRCRTSDRRMVRLSHHLIPYPYYKLPL